MAVLNLVCNNFSSIGTTGNTGTVMTSIREGTTAVPTHTNEAGVGGRNSGSNTSPNNSTFVRFSDLGGISKNATIQSATMTWAVNSYDWKTAVTQYFCVCDNFDNTLNGAKQPTLYNTQGVSAIKIPISTTGTISGIDVTATIQEAVKRGKQTFKIYTGDGRNRKYMSKNMSILVTFTDLPVKPTFSVISTDCSTLSYANTSCEVGVSNTQSQTNTIYYRARNTTNNVSLYTNWSTNTSITIPMQGNAGVTNTLYVEASYSNIGINYSTSNPITIIKNPYPNISLLIESANNVWLSNDGRYFVNGNIKFSATATDVSLKANQTLNVELIMNETQVYTSNVTSGKTVSIQQNIEAGKNYGVYANANDGFLVKQSPTMLICGDTSPTIQMISSPSYLCEEPNGTFAIGFTTREGSKIKSIAVTPYILSDGVSTALSTSTFTNNVASYYPTIPNSYFNYSSTKSFLYLIIVATTYTGATSTLNTGNIPIIRNPSDINGIEITRSTQDTLGSVTWKEDQSNEYTDMYVPNNDTICFTWNNSTTNDGGIIYNVTYNENTYSMLANSFFTSMNGNNQSISVQPINTYEGKASTISTNAILAPTIQNTPQIEITSYRYYIEGTDTETPIVINGVKLVDISSQMESGYVSSIVGLNVPSVDLDYTHENQNSVQFTSYLVNNGISQVLETTHTAPGTFITLMFLTTKTNLNTTIVFSAQYVDRFGINGSVLQSTENFFITPSIVLPKIQGCGKRWVVNDAGTDYNLYYPTFFAEQINYNTATSYTFKAFLYSSDKTLIEEATIYPNNNVPAASANFNPSITQFAWKFNTSITLNDMKYIIIGLYSGNTLMAQSQFNDENSISYSESYNEVSSTNSWISGNIMTSKEISALGDYIADISDSYNLTYGNSYSYNNDVSDIPNLYRGMRIYATNNVYIYEKSPKIPSICLPLGVNLCPTFDEWYLQNSEALISNNSIVLNATNTEAISSYIPWNAQSNKFNIYFNGLVNDNAINKNVGFMLRFYDEAMNEIFEMEQILEIPTPTTMSYISPVSLDFVNRYDSSQSTSNMALSTDVYYIKFTLRYVDCDITISNTMLYDATDGDKAYTPYSTVDYSVSNINLGSKNSFFDISFNYMAGIADSINTRAFVSNISNNLSYYTNMNTLNRENILTTNDSSNEWNVPTGNVTLGNYSNSGTKLIENVDTSVLSNVVNIYLYMFCESIVGNPVIDIGYSNMDIPSVGITTSNWSGALNQNVALTQGGNLIQIPLATWTDASPKWIVILPHAEVSNNNYSIVTMETTIFPKIIFDINNNPYSIRNMQTYSTNSSITPTADSTNISTSSGVLEITKFM